MALQGPAPGFFAPAPEKHTVTAAAPSQVVTPHTTDADLAFDPRELDDEPDLASTLEAAGFELTVRPGTWSMTEVQIDFMVPASLGGPGRRGAPLGVHGSHFARKATGLEAAVVDHALLKSPW